MNRILILVYFKYVQFCENTNKIGLTFLNHMAIHFFWKEAAKSNKHEIWSKKPWLSVSELLPISIVTEVNYFSDLSFSLLWNREISNFLLRLLVWIKLNNAHESTSKLLNAIYTVYYFYFGWYQQHHLLWLVNPWMHTTSINLQSDSTNREKLYFVECR